MIVTLELAPGAVLAEQALSAELGIGRTPIREALQRLASEGLVLVLPRKAIIVTETDPGGSCWCWRCGARWSGCWRAPAPSAPPTPAARVSGDRRRHGGRAKTNDDIAFMRLDRELTALLLRPRTTSMPRAPCAPSTATRAASGTCTTRDGRPAALRAPARRRGARRRQGQPGRAMAAADRLLDYAESFTRATVGVR